MFGLNKCREINCCHGSVAHRSEGNETLHFNLKDTKSLGFISQYSDYHVSSHRTNFSTFTLWVKNGCNLFFKPQSSLQGWLQRWSLISLGDRPKRDVTGVYFGGQTKTGHYRGILWGDRPKRETTGVFFGGKPKTGLAKRVGAGCREQIQWGWV